MKHFIPPSVFGVPSSTQYSFVQAREYSVLLSLTSLYSIAYYMAREFKMLVTFKGFCGIIFYKVHRVNAQRIINAEVYDNGYYFKI